MYIYMLISSWGRIGRASQVRSAILVFILHRECRTCSPSLRCPCCLTFRLLTIIGAVYLPPGVGSDWFPAMLLLTGLAGGELTIQTAFRILVPLIIVTKCIDGFPLMTVIALARLLRLAFCLLAMPMVRGSGSDGLRTCLVEGLRV
jgi:type III secretory pathway component EscV